MAKLFIVCCHILVICYVNLALLSIMGKATQLLSNTSVACPDETVSFTCSSPSSNLWTLTPPLGDPVFRTIFSASSFVGQMFMVLFLGQVLPFVVNTENVSSTFTIRINNASLLEGSSIACVGGDGVTRTLNITIADPPSPPLNPNVTSKQNELSSSTVTVEWDPPSSPGGVSVSYVLTISPPPLSQSPLTVETTSAQITVSYNTQYNLTIRADNCAGSSDTMLVIPQIVTCPSAPTPASGVRIDSLPSVPVEGSILTFTCIGVNQHFETSTCGAGKKWFPNPQTYVCPTGAPLLTCDPPGAPSNGTVSTTDQQSYTEGSTVTFQCDPGLFPFGVMSATCTRQGQTGVWVPYDPGNMACRTSPVNCTLPPPPVNVSIVDYERLNRTVVEGTVLTYQCDDGLSLTGPTTITCTNAGQWSPEPATITCVTLSTPAMNPLLSLSTGAAVGVTLAVSAVVFTILGFLAGVLVTCLITRAQKKASTVYSTAERKVNVQATAPAGPVYEDVSKAPKEEIELNTNQAYGPLGQ